MEMENGATVIWRIPGRVKTVLGSGFGPLIGVRFQPVFSQQRWCKFTGCFLISVGRRVASRGRAGTGVISRL